MQWLGGHSSTTRYWLPVCAKHLPAQPIHMLIPSITNICADPRWLQAMQWINVALFGPFYAFAIIATIKGSWFVG
jgi:hypothetical protein